MINGNNMYIQTAGMNIRKDNDDWRRAVDTVDAAETAILTEKTITENGTYTAAEDNADGYSSVTVDVAGGGGAGGSDVIFYDYDGTVVASYSAADFANLSTMPDNPTHEGLTAQGWNWSLADAKSYVAAYGKLNIGQMYITSDGKTRIYINLPEGRTSPVLTLYLETETELDIDWGDGSVHSTWTASDDYMDEKHNYPDKGEYVIAITVVSGSFILQSSSEYGNTLLTDGNDESNNRAYLNSIQKIEIGTGISQIGDNAFNGCYSLSSITIPDGVDTIYSYVFNNCYSLSSITIPTGVTALEYQALYGCATLSSVALPNTITTIGNNAISTCYSLSSITIPDSVTSIGNNAFYGCNSLSSITIPDSVTTIGNYAFVSCGAMDYIKFTRTTPPTVSSSAAWTNVSTSTKILVPAGTLATYKSASNYPDPSLYIYEEY